MGQRDTRNLEIEQYIIENLRNHPQDMAGMIAKHFELSRQAAVRHLQRLQRKGTISASGNTRGRKYEFIPVADLSFHYEIKPETLEDTVWRKDVSPILKGGTDNVRAICQYGFTEIFNNALEHSEGKHIWTYVTLWPDRIRMLIADDGIGIFNKIQRDLRLDDPLHALLELSKGKLSTDPQHHTGEGIFFTSRAFDEFTIASGRLRFFHDQGGPDYMFELQEGLDGTSILMEVDLSSNRTLKEVFDQYSVEEEGYDFDRTVVPVFLAQYGDEKLLSRSQARRLLARVERFKEVVLDFDEVNLIGQAFADEIFRVFQREHPEVRLVWMNENKEIRKMIQRARSDDTSTL